MSVTGVVLSVSPDWRGSALTADTTTGTTVLSVEDAVDFDEEGGWLVIADESTPRQYLSVDFDADTVTLAAAVGAVFDADLPVVVWDPTVPGGGSRVVEYVAQVDLDGDAGSADATIDHERIPTAGGVDFLLGATVVLEEADEDDEAPEWLVVQVVGREAAVDAGYVSPGTLDGTTAFIPGTEPAGGAASDGLAPASSPTPTLRAGISSLFIMWPAIDNADLVTYDVHLSAAAGFAPSAATLAGSVAGTGPLVVKALTDGTPLMAGTTYYAKIQARDADGVGPVGVEASGSPVQATSDDIAVGALTTDMLVANDVLAGALSVTDLSTVNFDAVNIRGGSIAGGSIAVSGGLAGSVAEPFAGTAFPAGWTSVKDRTTNASVAASVVSTGPVGQDGSAILIDYGAAGLTGADQGRITTTLPKAQSQESRVRFRIARDKSGNVTEGNAEEAAICLRTSGTWNYTTSAADAVFLRLIPDPTSPTVHTYRVSTGGGFYESDVIAYFTVTRSKADPTLEWCRAALKIEGGATSVKVWRDGDPEPNWRTYTDQSVPTAAGLAVIAWEHDPLWTASGLSAGGQKVWIDSFDAESYDTGFQVLPDGTGEWPHLEGRLRSIHFDGYISANVTVPNATWFTIPLDVVTTESGLTWDPTTRRLTVVNDGLYLLKGQVNYATNNTGTRYVSILTGTGDRVAYNATPTASAGSVVAETVRPIRLTAGTTLELQGHQNSGGTLAAVGGAGFTHMTVTRLAT